LDLVPEVDPPEPLPLESAFGSEILGDLTNGATRGPVQLDRLNPEIGGTPDLPGWTPLPGPRAPLSGVHRAGSRPGCLR
jgi:hypothetical protein